MRLEFDKELFHICQEIVGQGLTLSEWSARESSDMFQSNHYCGGFDAEDGAFCFSHYDEQGREFWFCLTLSQVKRIAVGESIVINLRAPNK